MKNLISIIIPVYNAEKYISSCIDSILNQTIDNFEIILINDGSTDNSLSILNDYKNKDIRVVVIDKVNEGVSIARNVGIKHSKGKYITFIDSDDFLEPNALETMLNLMIQFNSDIVRTSYYYIKNDNKYEGKKVNYEGIYKVNDDLRSSLIEDALMQKMGCYLWVLLIKKDLLIKNNITFNELLFVHQDIDFYVKLFLHCKTIYFSNLYTYNYIINGMGSKNIKYYERNKKSIINLYKALNKELKNKYKDLTSYLCYYFIISYIYPLSKKDITKAENEYNKLLKDKVFMEMVSNINKKSFKNIFSLDYIFYKLVLKSSSFKKVKFYYLTQYKIRNLFK